MDSTKKTSTALGNATSLADDKTTSANNAPAKVARKILDTQVSVKKVAPKAKTPAKQPMESTSAPVKKTAPINTLTTPKGAAPAKPVKNLRDKKLKVIRDSFSIPKTELNQINDMKIRAMTLGVSVKKSELLRAGLQALRAMSDTSFKKALAAVPTIKTGRPAKG